MLRTLLLIIFILCFSYFTGLFWFLFCDLTGKHDSFIYANDLDGKTNYDKMILLTYFAFTTLSTVGLGDYHPVQNNERLLGTFILLFGVWITSFIMENLNNMITQLNSLFKNFEQNSELNHFLGTLEKFNGDKKLTPLISQRIIQYFDYRWSHNKNNAIST